MNDKKIIIPEFYIENNQERKITIPEFYIKDEVRNNDIKSVCDPICEICMNPCQLACMGICESTCQICLVGCQTSCEYSCMESCESGCQDYCESWCQSTCQTSCQSTCESACQDVCELGGEAPERPPDWQWYTSKVAGQTFRLTAAEWNAFMERIMDFREYKGHARRSYDVAVTGQQFKAVQHNQACDSIRDYINPPISPPPYRYSEDDVTAYTLNRLRDALNSIE